MKIALVQIASQAGNIENNLARHLAALDLLRPGDADIAVFPELSLSGYEPELAGTSEIDANDLRLAPLDAFARERGISICAGAPLRTSGKPEIAALLFTPNAPRRVIRKAYLHADEEAFFAPGSGEAIVLDTAQRIGIAICHDINVDAHIDQAVARGADIYLAGVAKTAQGMAAAESTMRDRARQHRLPIRGVNCTGTCEGKPAGGASLVIDATGNPLISLGREEQALLGYDTASGETEVRPTGL